MTRVYGQNRKQLFQLTEQIGEGGEGTVFAWPSDPLRVCKIYHDHVLEARGDAMARKLAAMLAAPPDDPMLARGAPMFAWPEELLFDATNHNRLVGFVMPRIRDSHSLHKLYSTGDRKHLKFPPDQNGNPLPGYYVMVATARNLAEAFRLLHARGYVMADVNEDNIRFRTNATVSLIDNDSFQVRDRKSGEKFLVPVMKAEYWPVDSLELHTREEALSISHDQFGLALFLFRLLMNGVHPFHGMGAAGVDPPSSVENIAVGRFPFLPAHSGGLRPPLHAPSFDGLPANLRELFRRCFVEGTRNPSVRADAGTWVTALDQAHKTLKPCERGHMHFAEARVCPWCELEEARISCPKGHRYYRGEGSCPQCRMEQRRAARNADARIQATAAVSVPATSRTASASPVIPVLPPLQTAAGALPRLKALLRSPHVIRWSLLLTLLISFVGVAVWYPLHFGNKYMDRAGTDGNPSFDSELDPSRNLGTKASHPGEAYPGSAPAMSKTNAKDGAEMVLIPAGDSMMGNDADSMDSRPLHKVTLDGFYIYRTPVTVAQYLSFCKETGHARPDVPFFDPNWSELDHPIVNVSYDDALDYCKWAGVTLPTEAQWEKAASWDDVKKEKREYPWGDTIDSSKLQCSMSEPGDAGGTKPVGSFPSGASPSGALDMAGNVWQWCSDWYDDQFYASAFAAQRNPENQSFGDKKLRVARGGSWWDDLGAAPHLTDTTYFRSYFRQRFLPSVRTYHLGFRCASGL